MRERSTQFNNDAFWGMDDYDDASVETVIDSDTDPGGMNASWDDFTYTTGDTISCTPDITNTMNFAYETGCLEGGGDHGD